jgi:hypothetical protein
MMVVPGKSVECSAKIAMTALCSDRATMGLLPDHRPRRFIMLATTTSRILNARNRFRQQTFGRMPANKPNVVEAKRLYG